MTSTTLAILETYPAEINLDRNVLAAAVDVMIACSETCTACADACLSEGMVADLTKTIRTCLDCADICEVTARVVSRHTGYDANISRAMLDACIVACRSSADECDRHPDMAHCQVCAQVCRECIQACEQLKIAMR
jgi:hypothetical protein